MALVRWWFAGYSAHKDLEADRLQQGIKNWPEDSTLLSKQAYWVQLETSSTSRSLKVPPHPWGFSPVVAFIFTVGQACWESHSRVQSVATFVALWAENSTSSGCSDTFSQRENTENHSIKNFFYPEKSFPRGPFTSPKNITHTTASIHNNMDLLTSSVPLLLQPNHQWYKLIQPLDNITQQVQGSVKS